jgi:hypothetical protein
LASGNISRTSSGLNSDLNSSFLTSIIDHPRIKKILSYR